MFEEIAGLTAQLDTSLRPAVLETPLERRPEFDDRESQVWAKLENRQVTGSFKFRGAYAKLASLTSEQLAGPIITASTGNHGLAVTRAAADAGARATVFVSDTADRAKIERVHAAGAAIEVVPGDPVLAEIAARESAAARSGTFISPYNDYDVIAGQGTIAAELLRQVPALAGVVIAVGGGGLISGIAATLKAHDKDIKVVAASATNSAAMHHSVVAGRIVATDHLPTLSDGTAGGIEPGAVTFAMCRQLVDAWVLVDEAPIAAAMKAFHTATGETIEGSAGVALAAVKEADVGGPTAIVICGGNISGPVLAELGIA